MNKGVIELGTKAVDNLLASLRPPRTKDVVLKGGQGVLTRGTLVQDDGTGVYEICDDETKMAGVLFEDVDTGSDGADNVDFYVAFDVDLHKSAVTSGVTSLPLEFFSTCGINIKE